MRRVILAESAGFCYGVRRAVKLAEETAAATADGCRMLGDLIHNAHVVEDLARQGVRKVSGSGELTAEDTVIIRSHGELKSVLDELEQRGIRPDVVCVDPPRKGLAPDVVEAAASMEPERIVYVSCDPATLARDVARFAPLGYRPVRACAVDLFPGTANVETVCLLSKRPD